MLRIVGFPAAAAAGGLVARVAVHDEVILIGAWVGAIVYGAIADRWWTAVLPLVWIGGWVAVVRVVDLVTGDCSVCSSDEDWGNYPLLILVIGVAPLTAAVLAGVGGGKLVRRLRGR